MKTMKETAKNWLYKLPSSVIFLFHHISVAPEIQRSGSLLNTEFFYDLINRFSQYGTIENVIQKPQRKKVAVTFDDGLSDVYNIAYPFLKKKNVPFTVFIVLDFIDKPGFITSSQLLEMASDPIVTVGSHGISHAVLPGLSMVDKKKEIICSQAILENIIHKKVDFFAYSHGQYNKECIKCCSVYKYAFSVHPLPCNVILNINKKILPRLNIDNSTFEYMNQLIHKFYRGCSVENTEYKE